MATFPALTPNARTFVLGNFPQIEYVGTSGVSTRFLYNTGYADSYKLTLVYNSLAEADINSLYNHYDGQQGSLIPFILPAAVWAGYDSVPVSALDYEWRYASPLAIEPSGVNRFSTTVELETVLANVVF
jgi:hypothetical protein